MLGTALKIVLGLTLAYLVLSVLAWRFQERLAFPGPNSRDAAPADVGIRDGERVRFTTADGVELVGWYLPPTPDTADGPVPGLLWFYGNMETVVDIAPILQEFRPPGVALFAIDYRGYGQSTGRATEPGLYADAEAAWDYLAERAEVDATRIGVYGRSLGSAVALHVTEARPVQAIVLDSPFTSARAMARRHYPWAPPFLMRLQLDNLGRAHDLSIPLLVFHGARDFIAPVAMGEAVAEAGRAEEFVRIEGAGHNDTYTVGGEAYRARLFRFVEERLR
jgi:fermentation-respiration switch protein FrsA (DUF1100 family)